MDKSRIRELEPFNALYLDLLKKCLSASIYEESAWKIVECTPLKKSCKWNIFELMRNQVRRIVITGLRSRSLELIRRNKFILASREQGADWPCFGYTMIGHRRLDNLEKCLMDILEKDVPGDVIETGAWRGGATIFMRAILKAYEVSDRSVWVADSFQGMPMPANADDGWDFSKVEQLNVSLDQVKANFARFGLLDDQVKFLPGWFKDTLPTAPIEKLAILRLDGDLYTSTMGALTNLFHKVSPGGYVIVDDYYGWDGCKRAIQEFRAERGITAKLVDIDRESVFWQVR